MISRIALVLCLVAMVTAASLPASQPNARSAEASDLKTEETFFFPFYYPYYGYGGYGYGYGYPYYSYGYPYYG